MPSALRSCARRLCAKLGIKTSKVTKPAKHLDFSQPDMEKVRLYVRTCSAQHGVHPRLIANFDQVYSSHLEHAKSTLHKRQCDQGKMSDVGV